MFLSAYLAVLCSQFPVDVRAGENPLTQLVIKQGSSGASFEWSDTDETLRGTLGTSQVRAGRTFTVSATVEPMSGPPFEGPLTITVRPIDHFGETQTQTVERTKGERVWNAKFNLSDPVQHRLEISWRSTHHKVVRGLFDVKEAGLPEWARLAGGIGAVVIALIVGLWVLFANSNKKEQTP